jgi:hypothetical protein
MYTSATGRGIENEQHTNNRKRINEGTYGEQVLRFRGYALIGSAAHLVAGSDWRLFISADTLEQAEEMIKDEGFKGDIYLIMDSKEEFEPKLIK